MIMSGGRIRLEGGREVGWGGREGVLTNSLRDVMCHANSQPPCRVGKKLNGERLATSKETNCVAPRRIALHSGIVSVSVQISNSQEVLVLLFFL